MAKCKMEGDKRIVIDFSTSGSCSYWIKRIRYELELEGALKS